MYIETKKEELENVRENTSALETLSKQKRAI
jgi:hypothetical protein